jgi:hypothetical protein
MKPRSLLILCTLLVVGALSSQTAYAGQLSLAEFPPHAPVTTFEKFGLTVEGLNFYGGVLTGVWMNDAFGQSFYGNLSTVAGYTSYRASSARRQ